MEYDVNDLQALIFPHESKYIKWMEKLDKNLLRENYSDEFWQVTPKFINILVKNLDGKIQECRDEKEKLLLMSKKLK